MEKLSGDLVEAQGTIASYEKEATNYVAKVKEEISDLQQKAEEKEKKSSTGRLSGCNRRSQTKKN